MPRTIKTSGNPEVSKASETLTEDSSPQAIEDSSPKVHHNLESHSLTAREQLMRQWPTWDWETR